MLRENLVELLIVSGNFKLHELRPLLASIFSVFVKLTHRGRALSDEDDYIVAAQVIKPTDSQR
ncbi:hypothetical protein L917_05349 [Phytophthora nicotianae]|uniref:Uncharacterized protein n=1 Tax=Phytophthora nicotianae TaxID=4792 RepID=W2NPC6_PHYNI|nr:hypothetical protein L915_05524 [Phytophthora nicotianae]ETL44169.1 hypothetical protein L916_05464 [Phytophthora nicotianae]ETL97342.1 hypothetical protein L917_05349 [Phytophthora nicotianae]ETM50492.1 hypothetical protein L914_05473 [Phytophthora nicotianae]